MAVTKESPGQQPISVLVADDSIVFRRYLRDIIAEFEGIDICGEAKNGIEALDLVLKVRPSVILMDMEMPLMDGMTALQHLMIHCPTPTIMFSSLTREGTFRAFDAMKNGAVDFFSKDLLFDDSRQELFRKLLARRILRADHLRVKSIEPAFDMKSGKSSETTKEPEPASRIVFCEECGARNIVKGNAGAARCSQCDDVLVEYHEAEKVRRNNHVVVFGGGADCCRNLLRIIPNFNAELGSSLILIIRADAKYVDVFTEYLDAITQMKVLRSREGMIVERGVCYVISAQDRICLQQHVTHQTLEKIKHPPGELGTVDMVMMSVASAFRKKCTGVLLSGGESDGVRGLKEIVGRGGKALALDPAICFSTMLVDMARGKVPGLEIVGGEVQLAQMINAASKEAMGSGISP